MDVWDQRRKKKRIFRQSYSLLRSPSYLFSVKSIVLFLSFLAIVYMLSHEIPLNSSVFRPVLVVSSLSLLSSSSSRTVRSVRDFDRFFFPWKIENRVLFPDHILLLVSGEGENGFMKKRSGNERLGCVYYHKTVINKLRNGTSSWMDRSDFVTKEAISEDEFDEFRSIVRCPFPSKNHSALINLILLGKNGVLKEENGGLSLLSYATVQHWENVAYSAALDGDSVVVFVKGLNLRAGRASDPDQFTCRFGLGKWKRNETYILTSKASSAAQEVVRCSLPLSIKNSPGKAKGVRVSIGTTPHIRARAQDHTIFPSVARISNFGSASKKKGKYELCVCTMLWNQAAAIREWIVYHSWLGVERMFIYDNNSDDGIDQVVQELDSEGYNVTRHVWPWVKTQEAGFSHCAIRAKDECEWVSFMDVDEYFYFPYSTSDHQRFRDLGFAGQHSLRALVANLSSSSRTIGEIRTTCHSFGPSGLSSRPLQGVTVGYTCRLLNPERHKSIIRPEALDMTLLNVVHHFQLKSGFEFLDLPQSTAVINHYKYQAWEVFRAKFYRRVATYVVDWRENQNEGSRDRVPGLGTEAIEPPDWPQKFCEVWDTGLRDFVLSNLADISTGLLPWERQ